MKAHAPRFIHYPLKLFQGLPILLRTKFQLSSLDFTFPYSLSLWLPAPKGAWALQGTWGYSKVTAP